MKKKLLVILIILISSIVGGTWYYISSGYIDTDNARIKMGNLQVISEVSGYITKISIVEGQIVKTNDALFEIDHQQYSISYKSSIATFEKAKSSYEYTKKQFSGQEELMKKQLISYLEFDSFKNNKAIAERTVEEARENMNFAKYRLDRAIVKSPGNGKIANFDRKVGDYVIAGSPLFNIIDLDDIWIEANFKEKDLYNIKLGQEAEIEIDAYPGVIWYAKVKSITPATESEFSILPAQNTSGNWIKVVQRIQIRLEFNSGQDLKKLGSGLSVVVNIKIRK